MKAKLILILLLITLFSCEKEIQPAPYTERISVTSDSDHKGKLYADGVLITDLTYVGHSKQFIEYTDTCRHATMYVNGKLQSSHASNCIYIIHFSYTIK